MMSTERGGAPSTGRPFSVPAYDLSLKLRITEAFELMSLLTTSPTSSTPYHLVFETNSRIISTLSERQAENKRKLNNTSKNNQNQQQPNKRQNTGKAYAAGHREKKYYDGSKPLCPKCNYHHDGPCPPKCNRCNIVGHMVRNCRRPTNDNTANNQRGTRTSQKVNCYECGNQGHYKRDCPERKNQSHKNQIGVLEAIMVRTLRGGETDQDPNNKKDEIEA
ncbi:hypothetical protein Tco_0280254 [Tanacetum coccineum]